MYISEPPQLINQNVLKNECINKEGYCVITLFPDIKKSNSTERNKYISIIHKVAKNYKFKPIHFLWAQENDLPQYEKKININKYPITIAVDFKKKIVSYNRFDIFDDINLDLYIQNLMSGKVDFKEYVENLEISEKTKWNRKDYTNDEKNEEL